MSAAAPPVGSRQTWSRETVELPKGDFGFTIARQFLYSAFAVNQLEVLQHSLHVELAGIAAKALKESSYHLRHSRHWVLRLGDGTDESHRRLQSSVDDLWMYTGEMFDADDAEQTLIVDGFLPESPRPELKWRETVRSTLEEATLNVPEDQYMFRGGRSGRHTEHLGHMLAQMQVLPRSHPDATW